MGSKNNSFEAQLAQDKASKTAEEIRSFAKEAAVQLSNEELDRISGGEFGSNDTPPVSVCPKCGSTNVERFYKDRVWYAKRNRCKDCGWNDL